MKDIKKYINLSREERREHLLLEEACLEIGGNSTAFKGLLAHHLGTTIPHGHKDKVHLCHACNNRGCSNPNHLYWGTPKDNFIDHKKSGNYRPIWEMMISKYGLEGAKKISRRNISPSKGGKGNKGTKKSLEHKRKISESLKKK